MVQFEKLSVQGEIYPQRIHEAKMQHQYSWKLLVQYETLNPPLAYMDD